MAGRSTTVTRNVFDFESILAGKAVDAPTWQLMTLCIIAMIIIFQPSVFHKTKSRSFAFWVAVLAVVAGTTEITLFPILSTIISTRTTYPYVVVIPHSFIAAATYRSKHGDNIHYLESALLAFFLYGFGGSIISDLLMGLPVTALSHVRIIPCYIIGWSLVWLSPFDIIYQKYSDSSTTFHYFIKACEAIDSVTTPMGRISRSARELQNKASAPIVAGLLAGFGGAGLRHIVGESTSIEVLETGFWKTLSYSLIWWLMAVRNCQDETYDLFTGDITTNEERQFLQEYNHCKSYGGSDKLRVIIVSSHTCWTVLVGMGLVSGHPLVWLCKTVFGRMGRFFAQFFRMGPASTPESIQKKALRDSNNNTNGKKKTRSRKKSEKKD